MFLGIEIGGTKLQLGVGSGDGRLAALERFDIEASRGAAGILDQIANCGAALQQRFLIERVGIAFGGPVDLEQGRAVKSHHIDGWDNFPLVDWARQTFGLSAAIGNDADAAALAEAHYGAGRGFSPVFYLTVGTGIGGGLVIDGNIYRGNGRGAAELGHLRPGLHADRPEETLESLAAGWGIAAAAQARLAGVVSHSLRPFVNGDRPLDPSQIRERWQVTEEAEEEHAADLRQRCAGDLDKLTTRHVAQAAAEGNPLALEIMQHACQALGWGIAQVITLLAPRIVIIGGGVSLAGRSLFFEPVIAAVERYVFPPFLGSYAIVESQLGEEVVVHGAVALAQQA